MNSEFRCFEKLIKELFELKSKYRVEYDEKSFDAGTELIFRAVRDLCVKEINSIKDDNLELAKYVESFSNRLISEMSFSRESEIRSVQLSKSKTEVLDDILNLVMSYKDQVKDDLKDIQSIDSGLDSSKRDIRKIGEKPVRLKERRNKENYQHGD